MTKKAGEGQTPDAACQAISSGCPASPQISSCAVSSVALAHITFQRSVLVLVGVWIQWFVAWCVPR
jgi:hypothetical protein